MRIDPRTFIIHTVDALQRLISGGGVPCGMDFAADYEIAVICAIAMPTSTFG
jgi:hypothetical protein